MPAVINLDFADVKTTLGGSGLALIGFGMGQGPNKAFDAAQDAISSPLLEASIQGAKKDIIAVTCGPLVSLYEAQETVDRLCEAAGSASDVKFGVAINDQLSDQILVSVIAADFTDEFDFSHVPTFAHNLKKPGEVEQEDNPNLEAKKEPTKEDTILPSFLRGKILN
jgi:cell division protein FtsZ